MPTASTRRPRTPQAAAPTDLAPAEMPATNAPAKKTRKPAAPRRSAATAAASAPAPVVETSPLPPPVAKSPARSAAKPATPPAAKNAAKEPAKKAAKETAREAPKETAPKAAAKRAARTADQTTAPARPARKRTAAPAAAPEVVEASAVEVPAAPAPVPAAAARTPVKKAARKAATTTSKEMTDTVAVKAPAKKASAASTAAKKTAPRKSPARQAAAQPQPQPQPTPTPTPAVEAAAADEAVIAPELLQATTAAPAVATPEAATPAPAARRRSRKAAPATPASLAGASADAQALAAPAAVEVPPTVDAAPEPEVAAAVHEAEPAPMKAAPRRRRRSEAPLPSPAPAEVPPASDTPAVEQAGAAIPTAPAEAAAQAESVESVEPVDVAPPGEAVDGEATPVEAPARNRQRRRRGRKEPGASATVETAEPVAQDAAAEPAPASAEAPAAQEPPPAPPAPPVLPPRPLLPLADADRYACEALDPDALLGRHRVTDRRTGAVHELLLRGLSEGDNHCDCSAFASDDQGRCPHLDTRLSTLLDLGPEAHAALLQGWQPPHSELHLRYGAERRIAWRPGSSCPAELQALAAAACDASGQLGHHAATSVQQLQQRAAELGHRLQVDPAVWAQLGEAHDAQRRVMALEAAYPAGPADATLLQGLLRQPLAAHQVEAALVAACAGRCVLADEPGLGKIAQVLATLALQRRHFGAERLLVAAPAEWLRRWQRAIVRWTSLAVRTGLDDLATSSEPMLRLVSLDELQRSADAVAAWSPDVLVIDEGPLDNPPWLGDSAAALLRLDVPATLVVLRRPIEARPDAVEALVRWLDPLRLGPTRRLLEAHARPGAAGTAPVWQELDHLGDTLLPLLLRRRRAAQGTGPSTSMSTGATAANHPADDDVHTLALTPAQAARHQAERARAERIVARWERVGDLSSREQRDLLAALQGMSQACTLVEDDADAPGPKTEALLALIAEVSAQAPDTQLVVFSQWPAALSRLGQALAQQGIGSLTLLAELSDAALADAAAHFRADARCRVALVADEVLPRLQLDHAHAGLVHLDRPWQAQRLAERLAAALPREAADPGAESAAEASVPVLHLVAEASIEEALLDAQTAALAWGAATPASTTLAALLAQPAGGAFLNGSALTAVVQQVRELLRGI